ncbi:hypothetical protein [uncultured Cohaesibacter sp.]|uniref:hypothetical protein n=1 Tax=uncultured Cohaesibacter sp. TaxID=1002546 RepID=UPI00292EDFC5|nr:hypothetical protein [uncultured Cohaesibacter sp.]
MSAELLVLDSLVADIANYAKLQLFEGNHSGAYFAAYVKLSWSAQSGSPCYTDCQNIIDALGMLRDLKSQDDCEDEQIDGYFVAMTSALCEHFPEIDKVPGDIDAIRRMGAALRKVA